MRPWSYSRLSTYEDCPKQFWYSYIMKHPGMRPESPAASRGTMIHDKAEQYLLNHIFIYPPELQKVAGYATLIKGKKAKPEQMLGVTDKWEPCDYNDPDCYARAIIDILYDDDNHVNIADWKSGNIYDSHKVQMDMYVPIVAAHYPKATDFTTKLVYVDLGIITPPKIVLPERLKPIRLLLDGRIKNAEDDKEWPVKPNESVCKWCDYSRRFGGPCSY